MSLKRRSAGGFTLIELLVVIAIISILAGLIFPVFARAKSAAHDTTTISNLKQMGAAFSLYTADNDDGLPNVCDALVGQNVQGGWVFYDTFGVDGAGHFLAERGSIYPYVKSKQVFTSPNDPTSQSSGLSFAFNGCLLRLPYTPGINAAKSISESDNPSGTALLGEEGVSRNDGTDDGFISPTWNHFAEWHAGGTAILHVDTHAKIRHAQDQFQEVLSGGPQPCWPL